eukprot:CAMPEP_0175988616 /NCGR_PEP_ID=MMETSP0108-20121206/51342_1 /TAXON_ID=195067 ORGANISM="Goniomonas pacifica, Strain CCMP1869" /NCGR_SAMPLE_ID=MMETSP0108 /ASSEMBLY_ACC=CAM_ASM_000204 /LENGTH=99 /DNA_ID=CAMNT_0017319981 /DNA_START=143 /DNA_END=443 /DNA_ORIENTATION=+
MTTQRTLAVSRIAKTHALSAARSSVPRAAGNIQSGKPGRHQDPSLWAHEVMMQAVVKKVQRLIREYIDRQACPKSLESIPDSESSSLMSSSPVVVSWMA